MRIYGPGSPGQNTGEAAVHEIAEPVFEIVEVSAYLQGGGQQDVRGAAVTGAHPGGHTVRVSSPTERRVRVRLSPPGHRAPARRASHGGGVE
nr:hypothetical protein GCM10017611_08380 [Rhodococcus wratislaviensis]